MWQEDLAQEIIRGMISHALVSEKGQLVLRRRSYQRLSHSLSQEARKFQREFFDEITPLSSEIHWPFAPKLKFESSLK